MIQKRPGHIDVGTTMMYKNDLNKCVIETAASWVIYRPVYPVFKNQVHEDRIDTRDPWYEWACNKKEASATSYTEGGSLPLPKYSDRIITPNQKNNNEKTMPFQVMHRHNACSNFACHRTARV